VSVATALSPAAINPLRSRLAAGLKPIRATITVLTSNPRAAELTASKGKAESTASAANANELFMKSAVDS
jgi:hypothetical protein